MKQILFLLLIASSATAQNFYHDSTVYNVPMAKVHLTDSLSQIYNLPVTIHVECHDHGDSIAGAEFIFFVSTLHPTNPLKVFSQSIHIDGALYNSWDANNDKQAYLIIQEALATKIIYITFD